MLVLTRKSEEDIVISANGDVIVIRILEVKGGKASIGVQADKKWQIVRKELLTDGIVNNRMCETVENCSTVSEPLELVGAVEK